jgi:glycosyltransferase involved in cell wall biosynthesis
MRILFLSDAQSIHTKRFAEHFCEAGHEVHIASFRIYNIPGVKLHLLPTYGLGKIGYLFSLPRLRMIATKVKPDIVHAHHITSYGFLAAMARLKPLVVTAWGSDLLIAPRESRILRWATSKSLEIADVITIVAEHMNGSAIELGAQASKIHVIPFGVDVETFYPRRDPSSVPNKLNIISTRKFDRIYDIPTLLDALGLLKNRGLFFTATLVGDGPLRNDFEKRVEKLGIVPEVKFLGHVEHNVLARLLAEANIFVTSSKSDGNNISLNEAMACGCFPIASDIPANRKWIENEINGLLFPVGDSNALADCLENILRNPSKMITPFSLNRHIAETRGNWRVCVKKMESIYQSLLIKPPVHPVNPVGNLSEN